MVLVILLSGCAGYTKAMYGEGPASEAYVNCSKAWHEFVPIQARRADMKDCMREAGWELKPGQQPEGPAAYRRTAGS